MRAMPRSYGLKMRARSGAPAELAEQPAAARPAVGAGESWPLGRFAFSGLPLERARRKTLLREVVKGRIWTLDQLQGVVNVNVPVRATIIK